MLIWAVSLLNMELSPHILTTVLAHRYSEFDWSVGLSAFTDHPVLYPQCYVSALVLKLFRREPAITEFD